MRAQELTSWVLGKKNEKKVPDKHGYKLFLQNNLAVHMKNIDIEAVWYPI